MKEWISKYQKAIVGTGAVSVLLIYQEKDPSFFCSINLSKTKKYLFIRTADHWAENVSNGADKFIEWLKQ